MNINHRAARIYDRALDSGQSFNVALLTEDLTNELLDDGHDVADIIALAASAALTRVDKERSASNAEASLFDSLDRAVPIAAGYRIALRQMTFGDWTQHLAHVAENAGRVNASAARENRRFNALAEFLADGLNTEQAVKAWQESNPGEVLA